MVPGLVGEYTDWKRKVAKTVDRGMDQNATVESIARRKVSGSRSLFGESC